MEAMLQARHEGSTVFHFERPRLNRLFMEAVNYPLVVICAGAGYGKTSAVHDFAVEYQARIGWIQLSERDNVRSRFWENFIHMLTLGNAPFAKAANKLGFPDTENKMEQYLSMVSEYVEVTRRILAFDDFHFMEDPWVLRFLERAIDVLPPGTSVFLISRSAPKINTAGFISKNKLFNISENDLRFTESELAQFFNRLNIPPQPESLHKIMQDTEGWAFALNLIARSYQKAPGYGGYLQNAMKTNIFRLMEAESWDNILPRLQCFLVRLSLIDHLSIDLIALLAGTDEDLITEMEKHSAFVRRDLYINAYLIHPLFLEFLTAKQELLSEDEKRETYIIAGDWCNKNGFKIDALSYFEKTGNYASIVLSLLVLPSQIPQDIAEYAASIFDRAPAEAFDSVDLLAVMHFRVYICLGRWEKSTELAEYYEAKFLSLPEENVFRNRALCGLYFSWGFLRILMCIMDDRYDVDIYFEKFIRFIPKQVDMTKFANYSTGPWINCAGSSRKGTPEEYIGSLTRTVSLVSNYLNGFMLGEDELARGELKFLQGDTQAAGPFIARAMELARENKQYEVMHRALLYTLRIAVWEGNYAKMEQAIKDMKAQLDENDYSNRFINYDISLSLYYCLLRMPEKIPEWLKRDFSPYGHAGFIENFGNQMKARFCFITRQYSPLLSYIREMKQRESYLFGRVEMLAMEACVHYKMKDKTKAFAVLSEAYKTASPNNLLMAFIELGKDMRTLISSVLKESDGSIPRAWLENVNRKSATYAKRQAHVITEYRQANRITDSVVISPREAEILTDLSHGLSRADIAAGRKLSVNTVKMVIAHIYAKLGAENLADLIRIAVERKMI